MQARLTYDFSWIETPEALQKLGADLLKFKLLSVDTETSGWQTGNEQLCLIQIGVPDTRHVYLVDVLKTGAPTALAEVLASPDIKIIAHNASFEERQVGRYDLKIRGIRDTLSMARSLRPDLPNHTLRTCCRLLLNKEISKTEQTSDWSVRPLTSEQVEYAALDAEIALELYDYLAVLEERVSRDMRGTVPELMQDLFTLSEQRFDLTRDISHEIAYLEARIEKVREIVRQKLIEGEPPYDGEFGSASISKVKRTEVNPDKVRATFPEFAEEVIQEWVDRKRFEAVAAERGLPKKSIELVLDTVGYNDRLSLALKDEAGGSDS